MRLIDFKDLHKDKECVILTCGPSLTEYSKKMVKEFIKDKIVICVKESIIEYKDEADYFFSNPSRERAFEINPKTVEIYQSLINGKCKSNPDLILYEDRPFSENNQLLKVKNFDKYNLATNPKRPWGPGILYETVFYFCLYAGFKNVYTIGWDLIDTNKSHIMTHYFEEFKTSEYRMSQRPRTNYKQEVILVNDNISHLYDYFKEKGMEIFVIGNQSYVNRYIPRKYL